MKRAASLSNPAAPDGAHSARHRETLAYLALATLLLAPGLAASVYGVVLEGTALGEWHARMIAALHDIRFGSGLRFWLGVTGAAMMTSLLLYPMRKLFPLSFRLGRVAGWFRWHLFVGVMAPVLILYHTNFGFGGFNANVALVAMLTVAASGIVGHFVHHRASRHREGGVVTARAHLDAVVAALRDVPAPFAAKSSLIERLQDFDGRLASSQRSIAASLAARMSIEVERRRFVAETRYVLSQADGDGESATMRQGESPAVLTQLARYFAAVRQAGSAGVGERLWALWRLFHLPVFMIMTAAAALHVAAVWDMDDAAEPPAIVEEVEPDAPLPPPSAKPPPSSEAASDRVAVRAAEPSTAATSEVVSTNLPGASVPSDAHSAVAPQRVADAKPAPQSPPPDREPSPRVSGPDETVEARRATPAPAQTTPPPSTVARKIVTAKSTLPPTRLPIAGRTPPGDTSWSLVPDASKPAVGLSAGRVSADAEPGTHTATARSDALPRPPMSLGAGRDFTLTERIAKLKTEGFDHDKTKFPLVGKHKRVACANCHTTTLEKTPMTCVSCHRKDDAHRGRRPDCARCHSPIGWDMVDKKKRR